MSRERGFALVGVVMFILVLTILGLSLFSLTGYESQFMQQSLDRSQALQSAAGGLDRACYALSTTSRLSSVKSGLPLDDVIYAVARRGNDSTGTINWNDPSALPVTIRVKARRNGQVKFLEAIYQTSPANSLYKRLFALLDSVHVVRSDPNETPPSENWKATRLYGEIWQNIDTLPAWPSRPVGRIQPPPTGVLPQQPSMRFGGVPAPQLDPYFAQFWGAQNAGSGSTYTLDATGSPDSVKFFQTAWISGNWSAEFTGPVTINVKGTAIWLFDRGIKSNRLVQVHGLGAPSDMLVIVARASPATLTSPIGGWAPETQVGIALLSSIHSPGVPVILVTDGGVLLQNRDYNPSYTTDDKAATTVNYLSVFARWAKVMGPDADGNWAVTDPVKMIMRHDDTSADWLVNKLSALGYLPNTGGAPKGKLRLLAGSWREVTESNPY